VAWCWSGGGVCIAWTPCCRVALRLDERATEHARVVACPRDAEHRWRLEFVRVAVVEWGARWTPVPPHVGHSS